jgi:hypothetical protein
LWRMGCTSHLAWEGMRRSPDAPDMSGT